MFWWTLHGYNSVTSDVLNISIAVVNCKRTSMVYVDDAGLLVLYNVLVQLTTNLHSLYNVLFLLRKLCI